MKGTYALIAGQVGLKLFTFVLNQVLLSSVLPQALGLATYLEFLTTTVLIFSREAARLAIQRTPKGPHAAQSIVNFGWVPLALAGPITAVIVGWNWNTATFQRELLPLAELGWVLALLATAIVLELSVEPLYEYNQYQLGLARKARYEGLAVVVRGVVTVVGLQTIAPVLAFAVGQVAYSLVLWAGYVTVMLPKGVSRWPKGGLDTSVVAVWRSYFVQMFFKQVLTEGDKVAINYYFSIDQQAVYAVMGNYGLIVARLVFQPLEELVRVWFTKMAADRAQARQLVETLCVFYVNLVVLIAVGGYANAGWGLRLLLLRRGTWDATELFDTFPVYVLYLGLLAFNGVFEALYTSIASTTDIRRYSYFMTALCLAMVAVLHATIGVGGWGLSGLIAANAVNMGLRIAWCGRHLMAYFGVGYAPVAAYVAKYIALYVVVAAVQYLLIGFQSSSLKQVVVSAGVCVSCLAVQLFMERRRVRQYISR